VGQGLPGVARLLPKYQRVDRGLLFGDLAAGYRGEARVVDLASSSNQPSSRMGLRVRSLLYFNGNSR